jgi:hypothetical protein
MSLTVNGFTLTPISIANTPEELNNFVTQEASLPQLSRIILEVQVDPSEDIESVAQQIQATLTENQIPYWPEFPNTYTIIDGNTLCIAYMRPSSGISPTFAILPILLIVGIIAPIIMYFAIPGFAELMNSIIMLVMMMVMMNIMGPMFKSVSGPTTGTVSAAEKPLPIEQRISRRIESIAESIERTERAFERSKESGVAAVSSVLGDMKGVASAIRGAPSTAMSSYKKSKAAGRLDTLDDKLEKYKKDLTPDQREKLEEEQSIVSELRDMYG